MFRGVLSFFLSSSFFLLFFSFSALAQTPAPSIPENFQSLSVEEQKKITEEFRGQILNEVEQNPYLCFRPLESVKITLNTDTFFYQPGENIIFSGFIENKKEAPIFDGYILGRLYREEEGEKEIIEEVILFSDISVPALGKKDINLKWLLPKGLAGGKYRADFFLSVGKKFDTGGIFASGIPSFSYGFNVDGPRHAGFYIDSSKTAINGKNTLSYRPNLETGSRATVEQTIYNKNNASATVMVSQKLELPGFLIEGPTEGEEKIQTITIPPKGQTKISFYTNPLLLSSYVLKTSVEGEGSKLVSRVPLVTTAPGIYLQSAGLSLFPLLKGETVDLFACSRTDNFSQNPITASVYLTDEKNNVIFKTSTTSSSGLFVLFGSFVSKADYKKVALVAEIKNMNGQIIDNYQTFYDYDKIYPPCSTDNECQQITSKTLPKVAAFIILSLFLAGVFVFYLLRKIKNQKNEQI
jgi:hypothetical protein